MRELTPPSASSEALLFSQPVTLSSVKPPLAGAARPSLMETSPDAACRRMAPLAVRLRIPSPRAVRMGVSLLPGDAVDLPIRPRPLAIRSIFMSPSLSARALLLAAGPRGASRGGWLRDVMAGAGMIVAVVVACSTATVDAGSGGFCVGRCG